MSGDLEVRTARHQIASRDYDGADSVKDALTDRQRMATVVDAAKRAGVDATQWLWNAREAERTLGRMILAARAVGDLAKDGQPAGRMDEAMPTLHSLGIDPHLAAYAVRLAKIPADDWERWHEDAEPTRAKLNGAAAAYLSQVDAAQRRAASIEQEAAAARAEAKRAADRWRAAQAEAPPPVPPLTDDETSLSGAGLLLQAAVGTHEDQAPPLDRSAEANEQAQLLAAMGKLAARITSHDPYLSGDAFRAANVMAARDAVRRLTDAAAVWLRTLNTLYQEDDHD